MKKNTLDHFVFYWRTKRGIILLVLYVNDIVITRNDTSDILSLKTFLQSQFHTNDLVTLNTS